MAFPLLTSKLYIPKPTALIARLHLFERLNEGLNRKLMLVTAPAGYGKTSLVSAWLGEIDHPAVWLSLDAADNDPPRFLSYFIAACQQIEPTIGQATSDLMQSPQPPALETMMTLIINDISQSSTDQPWLMILDDYHLIEDVAIHRTMKFLLDHLPPYMHVVLITREDPPFPLPQWRVRRQMTELRAVDLRFTGPEIVEFFRKTIKTVTLSPENIAALERRTEGWAAGLQLAALSLQNVADPTGFIEDFAGDDRYIVDYLVAEVLERQPPHVLDFLQQTSLLERFTAALCQTVTDQAKVSEILTYLEKTNLFLVALDHKREWYRYHNLFGDLLQNRLQQAQPDLIPTLHRRASAWCEANGWLVEAVDHALSAADYDGAAQLIGQSTRTLLKQGEAVTLRRWLDKLPSDIVRTNPQLCVASAWARLLTGPVEGFETVLKEAEQSVAALSPETVSERQALLAEVQAIRAIAAIEQGDTSPAVIQLAQQALDDLAGDSHYLSSALTTSLALAYHANGDTSAAILSFTTAKSIAEQSNNIFSILFTGYELAELYAEHGQLGQAEALHRQALSLVADRFGLGARHIPLAGAAHIGLGKLFYEWNDLDAARQQLEQGFEATHQPGGMGFPREASLALAFLLQALGDEPTAIAWMQRAEEMARTAPRPQVMAQVALHKVRLQLAQGQVTTAQRWVQESGLQISEVPDYSTETAYLTLVRTILAQGDQPLSPAAIDVTAHLWQRAEAQQRWGRAIDILIIRALAYQALGQVEPALRALETALSLAEPEGYVRRFIDEGQPLTDLLQLALARNITPGYTRRLLAAAKADQVKLTGQSETQPLIEPLTERELEVLDLIAAGLSNKAISETLFITVGTVKRHTVNIYGKLGVNSRTQATVQARELRLIE